MVGGDHALARSDVRPPPYAFVVGHERYSTGNSWDVSIFGNREGRDCWWTEVVRHGLPQRYETCGYSVPHDPWQLASSGPVGNGESVIFFLTRPNLRGLRVLVITKNHPRRWIHLRAHPLSAAAARHARLNHRVGYALTQIKGQLERVGKVTVAKR